MSIPKLNGFLSNHESNKKVVSIKIEPEKAYFEEGRDSLDLNIDFIITGLTEENLMIKFIKVAIYDKSDKLITFRHLNHNAVGTAGIHTIGKYEIKGKETFDLFNPFFSFNKNMQIGYLRYMLTFIDKETKEEYYYGNFIVKPCLYKQLVKLTLPLKGLLTILDGHDYYSHHRRLSQLSLQVTNHPCFQKMIYQF